LEPVPDLSAPLSLSYSRTQTPSFGMSASVASISNDIRSLLLGGNFQAAQVSEQRARFYVIHVAQVHLSFRLIFHEPYYNPIAVSSG
jgi:hypothetical protein